jgi:hypothetical protein
MCRHIRIQVYNASRLEAAIVNLKFVVITETRRFSVVLRSGRMNFKMFWNAISRSLPSPIRYPELNLLPY